MNYFAIRRFASIGAAFSISVGLVTSPPLVANEIPIATLERTEPVDFQRELLPILRKHCLACHNESDAESDLVLETPETILKGGLEGPAVVAGKPNESLLMTLAAMQNEPVMPPEDNDADASALTSEELGLFALWIRQGARGDVAVADEPIHWKRLPAIVNPIYAAAQSLDGRFVVAGRANQAWVYDVLQGRYVDQLVDSSLVDSPVTADSDSSNKKLPSSVPSPLPRAARIAGGEGRVRGKNSAALTHLDLVQSLAFSRNGDWIASGGYRTVKLWKRMPAFDAPVQLPLSRIGMVAGADQASLQHAFYAADEKGIIYALKDNHSKPLAVLAGHSGPLTSLTVSPQQTFVASSGTDKTVRLWSSDHTQTDAQTQPTRVNQLSWIDDNRLAGACDDHLVRIWTVDENGKLSTPRELAGHSQPVTAILSLGAGQLVSASEDGSLRVWALKTGQTQRELKHGAAVRELAATESPHRLISSGGGIPAKLWDLESGKLVAELAVDPQLRWQRDQQSLRQRIARRQVDNVTQDLASATKRVAEEEASLKKATEANDKAQQEFDKAEKELKLKTEAAAKAASELATRRKSLDSAQRSIQTSEKTLADARDAVKRLEPQLQAAKVHDQQEIDQAKQAEDRLKHDQPKALRVVASPDGSLIATSDEHSRIGLWRTSDGKPLSIVSLPEGEPLVGITFGANRDVLAVTADAKLYRIPVDRCWPLAYTIGAPDNTSSLADRVTALSFSPDDQQLAVGGGQPSRGGELKVYRVSDGTLVREITDAHSDTILGLAFSLDGKRLASCGADRFMKVFDADSGELVRAFEGHTHHVLSVGWRADGRVLATGGADKVVKLWNATDGSQIRTIKGFGKEVTSVQFAGASDHLYAACGDQNLYRCDMAGQRKSISKGQDFLYVLSTSLLGKSIVFGGHDSVVRIVDDKGTQLAELKPDRSSERKHNP